MNLYSYNNQFYSNRQEALETMLLNKDYSSTIKYHFHDDFFSQFDWTVEPNIDLSMLYKLRAQQLRDKYKYIILSFSGGSDSTQILKVFLKHNIFIDEIQITHYKSLVEKIDPQIAKTDHEFKHLLEYEFAAIPLLKEVAEKSPNTKITSLDISKFTYDQYVLGKFNENKAYVDPIAAQRLTGTRLTSLDKVYLHHYNLHIKTPLESTCFLRGVDKPVLKLTPGNILTFTFSDVGKFFSHKDVLNHYTIEDFYWSKDAPLIPIKQSHMIKRRLEVDENFWNLWCKCKDSLKKDIDDPTMFMSPARMIERLYNRVIYPDYDLRTYAGPKPLVIPDVKLIKQLEQKTYADDFLSDSDNFLNNKYKMLKNQNQIRKIMFSKSYTLGKILFAKYRNGLK